MHAAHSFRKHSLLRHDCTIKTHRHWREEIVCDLSQCSSFATEKGGPFFPGIASMLCPIAMEESALTHPFNIFLFRRSRKRRGPSQSSSHFLLRIFLINSVVAFGLHECTYLHVKIRVENNELLFCTFIFSLSHVRKCLKQKLHAVSFNPTMQLRCVSWVYLFCTLLWLGGFSGGKSGGSISK